MYIALQIHASEGPFAVSPTTCLQFSFPFLRIWVQTAVSRPHGQLSLQPSGESVYFLSSLPEKHRWASSTVGQTMTCAGNIFQTWSTLPFRWAVHQHRACSQRDEPVPGGGAAGSQVETVQQRGDRGLSEQSISAQKALYFTLPLTLVWHESLVRQLQIKRLLLHQIENCQTWSPPPTSFLDLFD